MLIIAIPKSASTSVMATLGSLHNMEATQDTTTPRSLNRPEGVAYLHRLHGDIREINPELATAWTTSKIIHKQHVFPSENNIELLACIKKQFFLEIQKMLFQHTKEGVEKGIHALPKGFKYGLSKDEWLLIAKEVGLTNDLELFYNNWMKKPRSNTLIIQYKDVINKTNIILNKIEHFLNLSITGKEIKLERKQYSDKEISIYRKVRLKLKKYYYNLLVSLKTHS